jgi:hypothetical protein
MAQSGPRTETRTKPKKEKRSLARKDRASTKFLRLAFTTGLAVVLAVVLIKIIIPNEEDRTPKPDIAKTVIPKPTAEGLLGPSGRNDGNTLGSTEESTRTYRGQGGEPADDPTLTWEITLAISGRALQLMEGTVTAREFAGDLPTSDFSFSITPDRYLMNLLQSGTEVIRLDKSYDPLTAVPFSIDEKGQFFIYLTPKKLSLPAGAIPSRFLTEQENSPLISMQGFIRPDDKVVGTFHSIFGPDIQYVLEPSTAE